MAMVALLVMTLTAAGCGMLPSGTAGGTTGRGDGTGGQGTGGDAAATTSAPTQIPTAVVLDASGSMKATDAPGQRFAAARRAVHGLVDKIPDGQQTALLTYGTGTSNAASAKAQGCKDVKTLIEAGKIDKSAFIKAVDAVKPSGYTPIALALQEAAKQLPDSGERAIVLLSDGIDTCSDVGDKLDPCAVAKDLAKDGALKIHAVGFRVDGQTSKQLRCLSRATGGSNWDAVNDAQLAARLAATINPGLVASRLAPDGYAGLKPGMKAGEAKRRAGFDDDVPDSGRVEIVWKDCTLVFKDGVLVEIVSDKTATLDGVKPGDDVAKAERLYKNPDVPTRVKDGAAVYTADERAGLGYKMYFDGADTYRPGQKPSGTITKIVLCLCAPPAAPSAQPAVPKCPSNAEAKSAILAHTPGLEFKGVRKIHCYHEPGWAWVEYTYDRAENDTRWGEAFLQYKNDRWVSLAQGAHGGNFYELNQNPPAGMPAAMRRELEKWLG